MDDVDFGYSRNVLSSLHVILYNVVRYSVAASTACVTLSTETATP